MTVSLYPSKFFYPCRWTRLSTPLPTCSFTSWYFQYSLPSIIPYSFFFIKRRSKFSVTFTVNPTRNLEFYYNFENSLRTYFIYSFFFVLTFSRIKGCYFMKYINFRWRENRRLTMNERKSYKNCYQAIRCFKKTILYRKILRTDFLYSGYSFCK